MLKISIKILYKWKITHKIDLCILNKILIGQIGQSIKVDCILVLAKPLGQCSSS